MKMLKVMTIVGTRPEIIRLSECIKACDKYFEQVLVHTGQNWDHELTQVFLMTWASGSQITFWRAPAAPWVRRWAISSPGVMTSSARKCRMRY